MSYLISRRGYDGVGDIPTTVTPINIPISTPEGTKKFDGTKWLVYKNGLWVATTPPASAAGANEPAWWEKLLGVGGSVITSYSATQAANAQANLLAQQQASAYGQPQGSSLTKYAMIGGAAILAVVLLKRRK
jgi:hypothetical protein